MKCTRRKGLAIFVLFLEKNSFRLAKMLIIEHNFKISNHRHFFFVLAFGSYVFCSWYRYQWNVIHVILQKSRKNQMGVRYRLRERGVTWCYDWWFFRWEYRHFGWSGKREFWKSYFSLNFASMYFKALFKEPRYVQSCIQNQRSQLSDTNSNQQKRYPVNSFYATGLFLYLL